MVFEKRYYVLYLFCKLSSENTFYVKNKTDQTKLSGTTIQR